MMTQSEVICENDSLQVRFGPLSDGAYLHGLMWKQTGVEYCQLPDPHEPLWRLTLIGPGQSFRELTAAANSRTSWRLLTCQEVEALYRTLPRPSTVDLGEPRAGDMNGIELSWVDVVVGESADRLTVTVHVLLVGRRVFWLLSIQFAKGELTLWDVVFPRLAGLALHRPPTCCRALVYPRSLGRRVLAEATNLPIEVTYPSYFGTLQACAYLVESEGIPSGEGVQGLYLATHDGCGHYKRFAFRPAQSGKCVLWEARHFPENMGVAREQCALPYPVVSEPFTGSWVAAAKIYRAWATKQKWCPAPVEKRQDLPAWLLETPVWTTNITALDQPAPIQEIVALRHYLGVPLAYHWYGYPCARYDTLYPEYFPVKREFEEGIETLHAAGVRVVPYINGRLWDTHTASWQRQGAESAATKAPYVLTRGLEYHPWPQQAQERVLYLEYWGGARHAVMCPTTALWTEKVRQVSRRLVGEYNVDGVYVDQVASWHPVLCFDKTHDHPIGGGAYWVDGYRKLVLAVRDEIRRHNPTAIVTTEDHAEPFLDCFDAFLTCNSVQEGLELIPFFHQVYSGYAVTFGRYIWTDDVLAQVLLNAQMFLWGSQLGWFDPRLLNMSSPAAGFLRKLAWLRMGEALRYLASCEMLEPPELPAERPACTFDDRSRGGSTVISLPAVAATLWREPGGTKLALVVTNVSETEQEAEVRLPRSVSSVARETDWRIRALEPARPAGEAGATTARLEKVSEEAFRLTIGPLDAAVFELSCT